VRFDGVARGADGAAVEAAPNAAVSFAGTEVPAAEVSSARLFARVWDALTWSGRVDRVAAPPEAGLTAAVPAVRLLALLQALLTGGYDVRRRSLEACTRVLQDHGAKDVSQDLEQRLVAAPRAEARGGGGGD
jgi:hypothetical protein